jgi:hypothetical protein
MKIQKVVRKGIQPRLMKTIDKYVALIYSKNVDKLVNQSVALRFTPSTVGWPTVFSAGDQRYIRRNCQSLLFPIQRHGRHV